MALGFNSNLFNTNSQASSRSSETAGVLASTETAGTLASNTETAGLIASSGAIDSFESNNPFAPEIDYTQYSVAPETAGSIACETAGIIAFDCETAGMVASSGCETAGSFASSDSCSFSSSDGGFVC